MIFQKNLNLTEIMKIEDVYKPGRDLKTIYKSGRYL